jgi:UDP-glucose 4-epimerase
VRLFSVYGVGLRKQLLWDACQKFESGRGIFDGTGEESRDWLHVEDAARLIYSVVERADASAPVFNGGTGTTTSVKAVVTELARSFGVTPAFTGRVAPGHPATYRADMTRARAIGFHPEHDLHRELSRYADWYRRESQLARESRRG